ncbi:hypothetical protein Zmor_011536 [Zophobas morio]|uniref:Ankyrin repeat protein n=1 Tax=Zophobas morio TaxID=2755281 RepID=A0AA38ML98_9CUCU|nr:hypothetical protein Zmor_011536 [Zophobas morio]
MLKFDPYERDRIFNKDSFHYAILQGTLFAVEVILENFGMTHEVYKDLEAYKFINNPTIAYYSVLWGYLNLLTISLDTRHSKIVKIIEESFKSKTLLHFALQSELKKKNQIAELLVDYGLSNNVYKNAILHLSVQNNDLEFTKMLLDEDTNFVDARDKTTGNTVLHIAVKQQNREMVKLLLEKGSNVKAVNNLNEQAKHLAIQNQDLEILQMLLSRQQQHTDLDYHDEIMLHYAVATTNIEIINYVLDQNLDVNFQDEDGKTAVHIAAEMGHYQSVVVLLQKGANFSLKTKCGLTVLHCAVLGNNIDIIKMCLSDQQINMTDDKGEPPLFYAIRKGSFHVVELLLDKGAAVDITSTIDKDTVLHVASACTDSNKIIQLLLTKKIKIVSLLLDNGADITKISTEGINIWSFLSNSQMRKHETTINLILERGANPNLEIISVDSLDKTTNHGTPLSKAIASNCWDLVEKLLQYEAKIQDLFAVKESFRNKAYLEVLLRKGLRLDALNKEDLSRILMSIILHEPRPERNMQLYTDNKLNINIKHDGDTSLHQAVALGKSHVVTWLLQNQADVNATNFKLKTPLQVAVATKQLDIVHLLLKNGADINYYTGQNDAIWESLCKHFPKDCAKIIVNTYPNLKVLNGLTPLYYAVDNDDEHMVRRLMEKGADVNDSRAFRKAVQRGNISIVDLFLERGYQADSDNPANQEVMSIAGSLGNCSLIDLLLRRGFKINSANSSGDTALYLAAKNNHFLVTKLLILRGADVNCASQRGETLWDYLEKHDTSITEAILQKGVTEMRLSKSNQNSLLHYAIRHCDERLVNFLLQSPEVVLDCNDPSLKVEAILRKNSPILQALERRRFGTNVQVKERVDSCLRERRSFDILCWLKEDDMTSETDTSSLYKLLHLAVYLGNDEYVDFVFKRKIDMDSVDVYNSLYPLHFARENGVLKRRLLVEMTRWIDRQYIENKLWKLEDMRRHVLQR